MSRFKYSVTYCTASRCMMTVGREGHAQPEGAEADLKAPVARFERAKAGIARPYDYPQTNPGFRLRSIRATLARCGRLTHADEPPDAGA